MGNPSKDTQSTYLQMHFRSRPSIDSKKLKPSKRNATEIVDLIKHYQKKRRLNHIKLGRGAIWSDAGKIDDFMNISNFVTSVEKVQGLKNRV